MNNDDDDDDTVATAIAATATAVRGFFIPRTVWFAPSLVSPLPASVLRTGAKPQLSLSRGRDRSGIHRRRTVVPNLRGWVTKGAIAIVLGLPIKLWSNVVKNVFV